MASPGTTVWREGISVKRYKCGRCGEIFATSTNHWGTIYVGCKFHYYSTSSECVEAEEALKDAARSGRGTAAHTG